MIELKVPLKKYLLLLSLLFSLLQCKVNNNSEESDLQRINIEKLNNINDIINLEEITKSLDYIQFSNDVVLDRLKHLYFCENRILYQDENDVLSLFDYDGKFYRSYSNSGKGPGELTGFIRDIELDCINNLIYVLLRSKLLILDYNFNIVLETILNKVESSNKKAPSQIYLLENKLIYYFMPENALIDKFYGMAKFGYFKEDSLIVLSEKRVKLNNRIRMLPIVDKTRNEYFIKLANKDTIYRTTDFTNLTPEYIIDNSEVTEEVHLYKNQIVTDDFFMFMYGKSPRNSIYILNKQNHEFLKSSNYVNNDRKFVSSGFSMFPNCNFSVKDFFIRFTPEYSVNKGNKVLLIDSVDPFYLQEIDGKCIAGSVYETLFKNLQDNVDKEGNPILLLAELH